MLRFSTKMVEELVRDEDDNVALALFLRSFENGKKVFYTRMKVAKTELAQNQKYIRESLSKLTITQRQNKQHIYATLK